MEKTTENFQTEVNELLHLIIHSLYSHPEIFLRELVSNASDALDKLKIESLTDGSLMPAGYDAEIRITPDPEARTLTISDNGIGMTAEEVRENLGRIAHSGTKQFKQLKESGADANLIGQFGVGFYSAFIVADKVSVTTRKAGTSDAVVWESEGKGSYSLDSGSRDTCGTTITMHLKPMGKEEGELQDFTDEWVLRSVVKKHSDFITYPIRMAVKKTAKSELEPTEDLTTVEDVTLNSQKALWTKLPNDCTTEEYTEFYKHVTHDFAAPLKTIHYRAEGTLEFHALLFVPEQRPWNFDYEGTARGLSLYAKRVLIMDDCEDLLPSYLRFVKGVVDSSDLSLNVSREILQHDRQIAQMRKALTAKVLKTLGDLLKEDREKYESFWKHFGAVLKEGMVREADKKDTILPLFLVNTTDSEKLSTLDEYLARMKTEQPAIYYTTGESLDVLRGSPLLEKLKQKGYEVILFDHPVDEFLSSRLDTYKEKKFESISSPDLELDTEDEKKVREEKTKVQTEALSGVITAVKEALSEHIQDVQISNRLTESPVCLVNEGGNAHFMEHVYRQMGQEPPKQKRILEINPDHPIFDRMKTLSSAQQKDWSELLYCQALISEGAKVTDPKAFVRKMTQVMVDSAPLT